MQKTSFKLLKNLKNTPTAQLWPILQCLIKTKQLTFHPARRCRCPGPRPWSPCPWACTRRCPVRRGIPPDSSSSRRDLARHAQTIRRYCNSAQKWAACPFLPMSPRGFNEMLVCASARVCGVCVCTGQRCTVYTVGVPFGPVSGFQSSRQLVSHEKLARLCLLPEMLQIIECFFSILHIGSML